MQNKIIPISLVASALLFNACDAVQIFSYKEKNNTTKDVAVGNLQTKPMHADLDIAAHKANSSYSMSFGDGTKNIALVKNEAVMKLLQNEQADVLLDPIYEIKIQNNDVVVNVSGYPAKYKNFAPIK